MPISFRSAKKLCNHIEMLPTGPIWCSKEMPMEYPTIDKVTLYYRDPLQCLQGLLRNPLYSDHLEFMPYRIYEGIDKDVRVFTKWLSGDIAWNIQVRNYILLIVIFINVL